MSFALENSHLIYRLSCTHIELLCKTSKQEFKYFCESHTTGFILPKMECIILLHLRNLTTNDVISTINDFLMDVHNTHKTPRLENYNVIYVFTGLSVSWIEPELQYLDAAFNKRFVLLDCEELADLLSNPDVQ